MIDAKLAKQMYAKYKRGATLRGVAAEFGCSHETVRTAFAKAGLPMRSRLEAQRLRHGRQK